MNPCIGGMVVPERENKEELFGPEIEPGLMLAWGGHPNGTLIVYGEAPSENGLRNYAGIALITKNFFNRFRPKKKFDYGWVSHFDIEFLNQWKMARMLDEEEFAKRKELLYNTEVLTPCIDVLIGDHELYHQNPDFERLLDY